MSPKVVIRDATTQEYQNAIDVMKANMDTQDNPKVGIFWYQPYGNQLFGVVAVDKDSIVRPNVGGGLISCYELHKDVWKKEFRKQKYKNDGVGPFVGDYKDKPRGRVMYNPATDTYQIMVGSWINDHLDAIDVICRQFNLMDQNVEVIRSIHWEIGMGWENQ